MRKYILTLTALALCCVAFAIPSKRIPFFVKLSDGTSLKVVMVGDESFHYLASFADGTPVVENEDGTYSLAPEKKTIIESTWRDRLAKRNAGRFAKARQVDAAQTTRAKFGYPTTFTGKKKGLVILVNFANLTMKTANTQAEWNNLFNQNGYSKNGAIGSVHDYFYDQSYGKFDLEFDVIGPVTVAKTYASYGKNDSDGNDIGAGAMVIEACKLADKLGVNFKDYDWDGDGYVDQVFCIYAGYGEHAGASSNTIWPHEFELSSAEQAGDGSGVQTFDGVKVDTYAVSCELNGTSGSTMSGIGTACHEFSHCLGIPDFYDTSYSGGYGMGQWDLLDAGSYNGPDSWGEVPAGFTAYERHFAGWLEYTELKEPCSITNMPSIGDEAVAYIIYNDKNKNEYFILENRQSSKWFKYVYTYTDVNGMLAYHVDFNQDAWVNDEVNNDAKHQRMTIIPAGKNYGTYSSSDGQYYAPTEELAISMLFPNSNVTTLDNTSHAAYGGKLFNKNTDGSYYMNKPITNIKMSNGKISFDFMGGNPVEVPMANNATAVGPNAFTANWNAVSGASNYTVELYEKAEKNTNVSDNILLSEDFENFITTSNNMTDISASLDSYTKTKGWGGNKVYRSPNGIKLGTSSSQGYIITPTISTPSSKVLTVKVLAQQYKDGEDSGTITVGSSKKRITFNGENQVFVFDNVNSNSTVKLATTKRGYVSLMEVYDGEYTLEELESSETMSTVSTKTIEGVKNTQYTFTGLTGTNYEYRVKAVVDGVESAWSNTVSVTLNNASEILSVMEDNSDAPVEYFTLNGMKIARPTAKGIYIIRQGKNSKKIIIK